MRAGKLIPILLAAFVAVAQAAETPDYSAAEAAKHVGETATVTDHVERVNKASGGNIFINMGGRDRNEQFTVFISTKDAEAVGDVSKYEGKTITVSGKITSHKEKAQIVVTTAAQIKIKEGDESAASPSPSAKP